MWEHEAVGPTVQEKHPEEETVLKRRVRAYDSAVVRLSLRPVCLNFLDCVQQGSEGPMVLPWNGGSSGQGCFEGRVSASVTVLSELCPYPGHNGCLPCASVNGQEYDDKAGRPSRPPSPKQNVRKNLDFEPLSTTALILEDRPAWCSRKVRDLWWQGIPPSVRGKVWSLAIGNELNITHGRKAAIATKLCLLRGQGGPYHDMLHSILGAYTCYRPDVGYTRMRSFRVTRSVRRASLAPGSSTLQRVASQTQEGLVMVFPVLRVGLEQCTQVADGAERRFPARPGQDGEGCRFSLRRVAMDGCSVDPSVQGMSFIAAVLILNLDTADAFIAFSNLLNKPCQMAFFRVDHGLGSADPHVLLYRLPRGPEPCVPGLMLLVVCSALLLSLVPPVTLTGPPEFSRGEQCLGPLCFQAGPASELHVWWICTVHVVCRGFQQLTLLFRVGGLWAPWFGFLSVLAVKASPIAALTTEGIVCFLLCL
ncbi:hypothetical protein CB1_000159030 [Camelus ferus]|nr:hypothetical protein CB1_000159030 [Camelus ferus]